MKMFIFLCSLLAMNSAHADTGVAQGASVLFYLIAQMVGAGQLIQMLFGIDYVYAIMLVGILMVLYVTFGGMMATTWVQIVKAVLMIGGCLFISFLVMKSAGYSFNQLLNDAVGVHPSGQNILLPSAVCAPPGVNTRGTTA
ncbi:sodium:solute symporter family transporter [Brenneria goodwinii]|uniref:sodium:solute symporter family transporter n=1 Tax=Brenneria goodwinii TaxID=1109412 RepID=UPI0036F3B223